MLTVTALAVLLAGSRMLIGHFGHRAETLLEPPELLNAREQLLVNPKDTALKEQIRALDLSLRQRYFSHLRTNAFGAWLLLAGGVLLIVAASGWTATWRRLPMPQPLSSGELDPRRHVNSSRWAIGGVTVVVGIAFLVMAASRSSPLPDSLAALEAMLVSEIEAAPVDPGPSLEEWRANWPMFRGPRGDGVATVTNAPIQWDAETGEGVLWTSPVPRPGHSSPVVWGSRVFLTGGDLEARHVLCYDAASGELVWDRPVPPPPLGFPEPFEVMEDTGVAASTAATDGRRVYVIFATGELAALDFAGQVVWSKSLGAPDSMYGYASSLVVWKDVLLVLYDQGDGTDGKSRIFAFDLATGTVRWEQPRPVAASWSTPLVAEVAGQTQILTLGEPWVMGYDAATGAEIWRLDCLGTDLAPMPVVVGDFLVVVSPGNHVSGLRMDGQGNVTETHQAWQYDEYVPDITSPLSDGQRVYLLITYGDLIGIDGTTGEMLWEEPLDLEFNASPTLVGDLVYVFSTEGTVVVFEAGDAYREVSRAELLQPVRASPAFVDNRIFVRTAENLFCLGAAVEVGEGQP
jgi:outer membrane protein assembly factor BamB